MFVYPVTASPTMLEIFADGNLGAALTAAALVVAAVLAFLLLWQQTSVPVWARAEDLAARLFSYGGRRAVAAGVGRGVEIVRPRRRNFTHPRRARRRRHGV